MKIVLIGYGKMGQMIERVALSRGHEVLCRIDRACSPAGAVPEVLDSSALTQPLFRQANVAIEFSHPSSAEANVRQALLQGVPVVSGTTGWDVQNIVRDMQAGKPLSSSAFIWASNFSLGVNIMFALNRQLAKVLSHYPAYTPSITETHHIHKVDKLSGTAKTLAADIERVNTHHLPIATDSIREGEVPGIHTVTWDSEVDTLTIGHSAKSREGFALGAVLAAEWIAGKTGVHTMEEVLGL